MLRDRFRSHFSGYSRAGRSLISAEEVERLTRLFKIFANETRLRLLHALVREGELCVGDLAAAVEVKPQVVSNRLQRLVDRGIVRPRRGPSDAVVRPQPVCCVMPSSRTETRQQTSNLGAG
ncbi:metalloregulator ArsR/SmtB family transcription factor [bacterium]|nr:metalloregulator ArsR/SmtB family transcription factor [bacterium]